MHCLIDREKLLMSLRYVISVLKLRSSSSVLKNVLLEIKNNFLILISTDLEIEMKAIIDLSNSCSSGSVTVSGRKFFDICRALPINTQIMLNLQDDRLLIRADRSTFLLSTVLSSAFPKLENWNYNIRYAMESFLLKQLIESTYFSMAYQDVRYCLNGMLFEFFEKRMRTVTTDGHRLSISTVSVDFNLSTSFSFILPRKSVIEILRMLNNSKSKVELKIGDHNFGIKIKNCVLTSKLLDAKFPDYRSVFPENPCNILKIQREVLKKACSRIAILSNEKFHGIRLSLSSDQLKISSSNSLYEEAEEIIDIVYCNDEIDIGFNVNYLLDVLSYMTCREVRFLIKDEFSAVKIEDCLNQSNNYIIMPMQL